MDELKINGFLAGEMSKRNAVKQLELLNDR